MAGLSAATRLIAPTRLDGCAVRGWKSNGGFGRGLRRNGVASTAAATGPAGGGGGGGGKARARKQQRPGAVDPPVPAAIASGSPSPTTHHSIDDEPSNGTPAPGAAAAAPTAPPPALPVETCQHVHLGAAASIPDALHTLRTGRARARQILLATSWDADLKKRGFRTRVGCRRR
jgi:hypothetical protein